MTPRLFSTSLLLLSALAIHAQNLHLEPSVGLDNNKMFMDHNENPDTTFGVAFSKQWFSLPVYTLGLSYNTRRKNLQTWNLQFIYRNTGVLDQYYSAPDTLIQTFPGEQEVMRLALLFEQLYRLNAQTSHNQFFLGITAAAGYETFDFTPTSSAYYPYSSRSFNFEFGSALRYQYHFNGDWQVFSNLDFGLWIINREKRRYENPMISEELRESILTEIYFGSRWQLRVGVSIPLGKKPDTAIPSSK